MVLEEKLPNLPNDIILHIFSRLPAKAVSRCRCLSKLWASLLTVNSPYFTQLFVTQSSTRPRLLFALLSENNEWCLYSCPQPKISPTNVMSSISVMAEFCMPLPKSASFMHISPTVSGIMYFFDRPDLNNPTLCNPTTGHLFALPQLTEAVQSYFGYDALNKHFTVLAIGHHAISPVPPFIGLPSSYQILKLGSGKLSWRSINCTLHHCPYELHVSINGILYYMASVLSIPPFRIVKFDLNSEEFSFIEQPWDTSYPDLLVNFKGKLGALNAKWVASRKKRCHLQVSLWVLEDADRKEWSQKIYNIYPQKKWNIKGESYRIVGLTSMGDIVLTSHYITPSLHVYFYNLQQRTLREVEIYGFQISKHHKFYGCVDYWEQLRPPEWNEF